MYHHIAVIFFIATTLLTASCSSVKEQQPSPQANVSDKVISPPVTTPPMDTVKNGVELAKKGYETGGMTEIKQMVVDCYSKLNASNDRQLLELCTVIEVTASNLDNNFRQQMGIAGDSPLADQFFSFDSVGSRVVSAWIKAGFTDEKQRTNMIKVLVEKAGLYHTQSFSTQTPDQLPPASGSESVYAELMSLIDSGKNTLGEYQSYLKKHDFSQDANEKFPGFNIFQKDISGDDSESPSPEDVITLFFDNHYQLVAIFSFSIGSKLPYSKQFVEKSQVGNGQLVFLIKKHPMSKKIERQMKEWVSNAG